MSKMNVAVSAAVVFLGFCVPVLAAPVKITGVLVDEACYTKDHANVGHAHKGMSATCAEECAKKGQQVALVTEKGEVYEVMPMGALAGEKNVKLVRHMAHKVTLTGDVMDMGSRKTIHATALGMAK